MKNKTRLNTATVAILAAAFLSTLTLQAQNDVKPIRALLITGGCCHSYATQKNILKKGIEARANVIVDQIHSEDTSTNPPFAFYRNPNYARGYDVVIHDECAAKMDDVLVLKDILAPHRNGIPGVNLHCAMHSFRVGDHRNPTKAGTDASLWFDYLGMQSSGHGPKEPIAISFTNTKTPVTKGLKDWVTGDEELYNNVQILPRAKALATGFQHQKERKRQGKLIPAQDAEAVVVWTNDYYDSRVADDRYLDLVTRGLLWSVKKLNDKYLK